MPIYEYACRKCEHRFEVRHAPEGPAPDGCPRCGAGVRKLLSSVGIIFKGSGWHCTDYTSNGPRGAKEPDLPKATESVESAASSTSSSEQAVGRSTPEGTKDTEKSD